jgi:aerobic-type carbon monoxide dehydrogenase small subunit (CoxS/CutS family)
MIRMGGRMSEESRGFTRRTLVRGTLVGAIAATARVKASTPEGGPIGPGAAPLELSVNGATHRIAVEPRVTLADALRDRIGLTGTKVVCGRGACGACTVLLDGATVCSCLMLAHEAAGKKITTIEGLAENGRLSPIQEAFIAEDALQCGYCTSGMVLSCKTLLDATPKPSRDEIRTAIAGNLCRCGTYNHVFAAVERAAGMKRVELAEPAIEIAGLAAPGLHLHDDPRVATGTADALEAEEV